MVLVKSTAMESAKLMITGAKIVHKIACRVKIPLLLSHKENPSVRAFFSNALVKIMSGRRII